MEAKTITWYDFSILLDASLVGDGIICERTEPTLITSEHYAFFIHEWKMWNIVIFILNLFDWKMLQMTVSLVESEGCCSIYVFKCQKIKTKTPIMKA